jgi:hypothetical protein
MTKLAARSVISLAVWLGATSASATSYTLSAILDGAQETPSVITLGTGTLTGTYDDVTNALTWSGSFSNLNSNTTNAHFHGPAAVGVGPAGVQVGMTAATGDVFPLGVTSGLFSGTATITDLQEADLLAGLWYVNIHSVTSGGGEIRGQVYAAVPEPPTLLMLGVGFLGLVLMGRRRG